MNIEIKQMSVNGKTAIVNAKTIAERVFANFISSDVAELSFETISRWFADTLSNVIPHFSR